VSGLTLELELLTGAYRASLPDAAGPEWPPHPERVFSALAQSWADGGKRADERAALEWLERVQAPAILADVEAPARTSPTVYVPPNDQYTIPEQRSRQARTFQVAVPTSEVVRFAWDVEPPLELRHALAALAQRVVSVGHSSSLVRLAVVPSSDEDRSRAWTPSPDGTEPLRVPYEGRLADLECWFGQGIRPWTRATCRYAQPGKASAATEESVFGTDWIVFEDLQGSPPDVLALGHVTRRLRDALMSVCPVQPPPEVLSGHGSQNTPSENPHVGFVPLLDVGWEFSKGDLLGIAVVPPRGIGKEARTALLRAINALAPPDEDGDHRATLQLRGDFAWPLQRSARPSRASLRPGRWCGCSSVGASATPVLLDRFPDEDDPREIAEMIAASCQHIGLPEPVELEIHKHSAINGASSAYPAKGRRGCDWTFPGGSKLGARVRRHVVLRFEKPVRGPVIIGAGRYYGFGLCLPLREEPRP